MPGIDQSARRGLDDAESGQAAMARQRNAPPETGNFSYSSKPRAASAKERAQPEQPLPPPPPPEPRKVTMEEAQRGVYVPGEIEPSQTRMYNPLFHI